MYGGFVLCLDEYQEAQGVVMGADFLRLRFHEVQQDVDDVDGGQVGRQRGVDGGSGRGFGDVDR